MEQEWSAVWFHETASKLGLEPSGENAKTFWPFSDWGGISSVVGLWDTCPRYYDEFCDPLTSALADEAIELAWWLRRGELSAVASLPLTRPQSHRVQVATIVHEIAEAEAARRAREEAKNG